MMLHDDPRRSVGVLLGAGWFFALLQTASATEPAFAIEFARDIRPLFAEKCLTCHGPDLKTREAGLRLDRRTDALMVLESGRRAIVPGDLTSSELLSRVRGREDRLRMPPPDAGPALSAVEITLLEKWIQQGAVWQRHWSFLPVRSGPLPLMSTVGWAQSPLDTFVLNRLKDADLTPSPRTDRATLIKRLHYDLTGLPPAPHDVDRFLADRSPTAYEQLVDRLLHSPHFGERWGRHWLDKARFADTNGYESDQTRTIWAFRDWVIEAINRDLSFDQFTIEQLAGDLLPESTTDQTLATAFHRNTMTNAEGGTDNEEFRVAAVVDRVNTTMQVWMGMTIGCAQCHDHKYDPITQRNYYELFAIFNQTEDADGNDNAPVIPTPTRGQQAEIARLDAEIAELKETLRAETPQLRAAQREWEAAVRASSPGASAVASTLAYDPSTIRGSHKSGGDYADGAGLFFTANRAVEVIALGTALREPRITEATISIQLFNITDGKLAHSVELVSGTAGKPVGKADTVFLYLRALEAAVQLEPGKQYAIVGAGYNPQNRYLNVDKSTQVGVMFRDGDGALTHLDSKYGGLPPQTVDPGTFANKIAYAGPTFQFAGLSAELRAVIDLPEAERTAKQQAKLTAFFHSRTPILNSVRQRLGEFHKQRETLSPPLTPILRELPAEKQRRTHIHVRGDFRAPGAQVSPAVPILFAASNPASVKDRLGLARWLVDRRNPLVSRVNANDIWRNLFGEGLVRTVDDFGTRGERPTHPRLLDYLAERFMQGGWSRKKLIREIVMSETYRQSSYYREELIDIDPENRLWHRQSRFRVEAEVVRDLCLAASGLLTRKMGGTSVFPPLPPGITRLNYDRGFNWDTSRGEDRYRRGLYTFFKRTAPHPNLMTLDSPESNVVCLARNRSNTPLGALVTLNNEVYVEASQALARRLLLLSVTDDNDRIARAWRLCLVRIPTAVEVQRLQMLLERSRKWYRDRPLEAEQRVGSYALEGVAMDELAAWVAVARVILNLDEVTKRD